MKALKLTGLALPALIAGLQFCMKRPTTHEFVERLEGLKCMFPCCQIVASIRTLPNLSLLILHILCDNQFGFRKNHSTTLALIDLHDKISSALDNVG